MMPTIISTEQLEGLFSDVIVPWATGSLNGRNLEETVKELYPDALSTVRDAEERWLSGTTILRALAIMQDEARSGNTPTIFNMGPYGRFYYNESRRSRRGRTPQRSDDNYLSMYVRATYGQRRFTRIPLV